MTIEKDKLGRPKYKMFEPLYAMECWEQVYLMLRESEPVSKVAAFIQEEKKECTALTRKTLITYLYKFLNMSEELYERDQAVMSHIPLIQSLSERVDPQDVYQLLVGIQFERVSIAFSQEKKKGKVTREANDAVRVLSDVLESMSRTEKKKFDNTAIEKTVNDTVETLDKAKKLYEERFGSVAATIMVNPDGRRRLLNLLETIKSGSTGDFAKILEKRNNGDMSQ